MADYTVDSPASCVCATTFTEVTATPTAKHQSGGETFLDVTYVGLDNSTHSTTLHLTDNATDEEIEAVIMAYGRQWYKTARQRIVDAGAWYAGLEHFISEPMPIPQE